MFPGEDESDPLGLMMELLGLPPTKLLDPGKRSKLFFTSAGHPRYCQLETQTDGTVQLKGGRSKRGKYRGPPASKAWQQSLKGCDDVLFIDFIKKCLAWDPELRLSPREALKHEWMRRRPGLLGGIGGIGMDGPAKTLASKSTLAGPGALGTQGQGQGKKEKTTFGGLALDQSK